MENGFPPFRPFSLLFLHTPTPKNVYILQCLSRFGKDLTSILAILER